MVTNTRELWALSAKMEMFEKGQDEIKQELKEFKNMFLEYTRNQANEQKKQFASKWVENAVYGTICIILSTFIYVLVNNYIK